MQYNTQRSKLIISEYGRNIQVMAEIASEIQDREERNRAAQSIIQLMAIMTPQVREEEDYMRKLWDHLHIISHFELDVDSPYPKPEVEKKAEGRKPSYPRRKMRFAHYGNFIEGFIKKGAELPEGDEKEALTEVIGNMMKRNYLNWNRDSVNDEMIKEQLSELSAGKLVFKDTHRLLSTNELLQQNKHNTQAAPQQQGGGKKNKKSGGAFKQQKKKGKF